MSEKPEQAAWVGERDRVRGLIGALRADGPEGRQRYCEVADALLDLVNHAWVHLGARLDGEIMGVRSGLLNALAGRGPLQCELELGPALDDLPRGRPTDGARVLPGDPAELDLLRELAGRVREWSLLDQADTAGRRPLEDELVRLAARWRALCGPERGEGPPRPTGASGPGRTDRPR